MIHFRQERDALRAERDEISERMRFWSKTRNDNPTAWNLDCADAADTIDRLKAERDEARREVCGWVGQARNLDPNVIAMQRGWNVKVKAEPDARHDRPEEVVVVKVGRHRVREIKR